MSEWHMDSRVACHNSMHSYAAPNEGTNTSADATNGSAIAGADGNANTKPHPGPYTTMRGGPVPLRQQRVCVVPTRSLQQPCQRTAVRIMCSWAVYTGGRDNNVPQLPEQYVRPRRGEQGIDVRGMRSLSRWAVSEARGAGRG